MVPALIVMTILGCDDSATQCHYVSTVSGTWQTIASCDAASEKQLPQFADSHYPVIVAMCETSVSELAKTDDPAVAPRADTRSAEKQEAMPETSPAVIAEPAQRALPRRALALISGILPDASTLRQVAVKPVHVIASGYSWVAQKFTR